MEVEKEVSLRAAAGFSLSKEFEALDGSGVRCCAVTSKRVVQKRSNDDSVSSTQSYYLVIGTQMGGLLLVQYNDDDHPTTSITTNTSSSMEVEDTSPPMEFLFQHDHAVTCVAIWEEEEDDHSLRIITGCKDSIIRMFYVDLYSDSTRPSASCRLVQTLVGHTKPVTSFDIIKTHPNKSSSFLISGSWDGTAHIWKLLLQPSPPDETTTTSVGAPIAILPDHENSVCVAGIQWDDNTSTLRVATGSAGIAQGNTIVQHTVRIWQVPIPNQTTDSTTTASPKLIASVANDHGGPIRDLIVRNRRIHTGDTEEDGMMATCSNDGTVRVRDVHTGITRTTLALVQTPPLLLTLTTTMNHSTRMMPSYIAAGAEDGQVIIWDFTTTMNPEPPQILQHPGSVWDVLALPNDDLVTCCQDGTVRIFTRSPERMASLERRERFQQYATQSSSSSAGNKNAPSIEEINKLPHWDIRTSMVGKSEGQIQLFQRNQTAIAAQWSDVSRTWIEIGQVTGRNDDTATIDGVQYDHVFPIEVDVPASEGGGVARLQIGYNNGENPFLAAQRFIDAHMLPQYHLTQIADYVSQRAGAPLPTIGTAASTTNTSAVGAGTPIVNYQYIPISACKKFDLSEKTAVTTLQKMKSKIQEFLQKNDSNEFTNTAIDASVGTLLDTLAAHNRYHASRVQDAELAAITHMLTTFPTAELFPALDLARLTVLHPDAAAASRMSYWKDLFQSTCSLLCRSSDNPTGGDGPSAVAVPMLSLRLFANAFVGGPGSRDAAGQMLPDILNCANRHIPSTNKNIRLSVATVLHNACWYLHQNKSLADNLAPQIVNMIHEILSLKTYESEGVFRTIVSLGTLVMSSPVAKQASKGQYMASKVEPAASPHEQHVKGAAKEVYNVLQ